MSILQDVVKIAFQDVLNTELLTDSNVIENKVEPAAKTTKKTVDKLLESMEQNPNISVKEMTEKVGISVDWAQYHIRNLKKCGVIERVESDKGGFWKIK